MNIFPGNWSRALRPIGQLKTIAKIETRAQAPRRAMMIVIWMLLIPFGSHATVAEEPAEAFLTALREKGYYDLALTYLDEMETGKVASESFRRRIPLYRAETLIESAAEIRDFELLEQRLTDAEKLLEAFSKDSPSSDDRSLASETLANLRFRQAQTYTNRAESDRLNDAEKQAALAQARILLENSLASFNEAREVTKARLEQLRSDDAPGNIDRDTVNQLRKTYTQIRLRIPIATEYLADTFPEGSEERTRFLTDAEAEYQDVWKDYRQYAAGVDACIYAARCQLKLNQYQKVTDQLDQLLTMNDHPDLVLTKRRAGLIAIEAWRKTEPYPHEMVIQRLQPLLANLSRTQQREQDWLTIQLEVAKALRIKAVLLTDTGGSASSIRDLNRMAALLAKSVARAPGVDQDAARELVASWDIDIADEKTDPNAMVPQTFMDAKTMAAELIGELDLQRITLRDLRANMAAASETERPALAAQVEAQEKSLNELMGQTLGMLRSAMKLANPEVSGADLNHTRYLQAYCYFASDRYLESVAIGEFLMENYPTVDWTRESAGLVMNSWAALFTAAPPDNRSFEQEKLNQVCQTVNDRWPGSPEGSFAANTLARLAMASGNIDNALELLNKMSGDSAGRIGISMQLAEGMWTEVQRERIRLTAPELQLRKEEFDKKLGEARRLLTEALAGVQPQNVDLNTSRGSRLLARILIYLGEPGLAVDELERTGIGPLDLIKQNHSAVTGRPETEIHQREVFRTAIMAYLGCLRGGGDTAKWISKTEGVLADYRTSLKSLPAAESSAELTRTYKEIADELKSQLGSITDPNERILLAQNLATFLKSMGDTASEGRIVLGAATIMIEVADSLNEHGEGASQQIAPFYDTAAQLLLTARQKGFGDDPQASDLKLELSRYLGLAYRGAGKWDEAIKVFADLLAERPGLVWAQINAAETLQFQARITKNPKAFELAILGTGSRANPKTGRPENAIWGWKKLTEQTKGSDAFADDYGRCMFGWIESMMEYGVMAPSPKTVQNAMALLTNWRRADPETGGPKWKPRVEALELGIQKHLNKLP